MDTRVQAINVEIEKFKEFIVKFAALFSQENFNYNLIESQFEQILMRNRKLKEENIQAEARIKESLDAADKIVEDAKDHDRRVKAELILAYHRVQARFRDIEEKCSVVEKRQIKEHLKEVEAAVA